MVGNLKVWPHLDLDISVACCKIAPRQSCTHSSNYMVTLQPSVFLFLLTPPLAAVSGAVLQHGGKTSTGSNATVTLTVGDADRVDCLQTTGPVPTSIGWYDPQGRLVSRDGGDEVHQVGGGGGRVARLHFQNYNQSQGGKYECRVSVPGNNLEKLPVCIGECYPLGVAVDYVYIRAMK